MARFARALIAVALLSLVSGCAAGPALFGSQTGTVIGHVMVRACGGANRDDQNGCHVSPRSGVRLTFSTDGSTPRSVDVDNSGAYTIDLRPGTYAVKLDVFGSSLSTGPRPKPPFAGPSRVVVSAGKTVTADFTQTIELL
ncbi:MAG TPA: hypothetical protein VIT43_00915 [Candidatus Dormibacteraeota bacterium]